MSKRKLQIIALAGLLTSVFIWLIYAFNEPKTNEVRYQRMLRIRPSFSKVIAAEKGPLGAVFRPLHLSTYYIKKFDTQREALLATGYLTNVVITVSNAQQRRGQLVIQLDKVTQGTDALVCGFSVRSNLVSITCRVQDVVRFRHALEQ